MDREDDIGPSWSPVPPDDPSEEEPPPLSPSLGGVDDPPPAPAAPPDAFTSGDPLATPDIPPPPDIPPAPGTPQSSSSLPDAPPAGAHLPGSGLPGSGPDSPGALPGSGLPGTAPEAAAASPPRPAAAPPPTWSPPTGPLRGVPRGPNVPSPTARPGAPPSGGYGGPVPPGAYGGATRPQPSVLGQYQLAGWWSRVGAAIIDSLIITAMGVVLLLVFGGVFSLGFLAGDDTGSVSTTVGIIIGVLAWFIAALIYAPVVMARTNGATWGKKAVGIRVIRTSGEPMDFAWSALRELAVKGLLIGFIAGSFTFGLAYLLDVLWPLWDDENRALHDFVCSTRVVKA